MKEQSEQTKEATIDDTTSSNYRAEKLCTVGIAVILLIPVIFVLCSILFAAVIGLSCLLFWTNPFEIVSWWTYFRATSILTILGSVLCGYKFANEFGAKGYVVRLSEGEKIYRDSPCFKK